MPMPEQRHQWQLIELFGVGADDLHHFTRHALKNFLDFIGAGISHTSPGMLQRNQKSFNVKRSGKEAPINQVLPLFTDSFQGIVAILLDVTIVMLPADNISFGFALRAGIILDSVFFLRLGAVEKYLIHVAAVHIEAIQ